MKEEGCEELRREGRGDGTFAPSQGDKREIGSRRWGGLRCILLSLPCMYLPCISCVLLPWEGERERVIMPDYVVDEHYDEAQLGEGRLPSLPPPLPPPPLSLSLSLSIQRRVDGDKGKAERDEEGRLKRMKMKKDGRITRDR